MNKAHVRRLEVQLIKLARRAKGGSLENGNSGMPPSLSEAGVVQADGSLDEMLQCLPFLGVEFFETPSASLATLRKLQIKANKLAAWGHESGVGFVVLTSAQTPVPEVASCPNQIKLLRSTLKENGVLANSDGPLVLTQDYAFASPSTAAGVVLARSANGRTERSDEQGRSLKSLQANDLL